MKPKLYVTAGSGNSYKPVLVAHQLGIALDLHFVDVLNGETRKEAFLRINPRGVVPYLVLPDGSGIGESNALAWYLAEGSKLMPDHPLQRAQVIQWMIFEQTQLEPNISPTRFFTFVVPDQRHAHEEEMPQWLEKGYKALLYLNTHLEKQPFIVAGQYSVADVAVFGYTHMAQQGGFELQRYPALCDWIGRVEASEGFAPVTQLLPV